LACITSELPGRIQPGRRKIIEEEPRLTRFKVIIHETIDDGLLPFDLIPIAAILPIA